MPRLAAAVLTTTLFLAASGALAHNLQFTDVRVELSADGRFRADVTCDLDALALGVEGGADSAALAAHIEAQIGTGALHQLEPYRAQGAFPGADRAFERALALPFATTTTEAEVKRVAEVLTSL